MHYIDSKTGAIYPLEKPRWRGESGAHVNLGDAPGLARGDIDASVNSLWRYRRALSGNGPANSSGTCYLNSDSISITSSPCPAWGSRG